MTMEAIALTDTVIKFIKPQTVTCGLELGHDAAKELLQNQPYLVVINQYKQPQGLLTIADLPQTTVGEANLQPLPAIATHTTIKEFLDRLCQYDHSASIWAVVDRHNRYLGVIEVLPLIRHLAIALNHQSLKQFIQLVNQLPFPILVWDSTYVIIAANHLWHKEFPDHNWQGEPLIQTPQRTWQISQASLADMPGLSVAIAQDITAQTHLAQELADQNADLVNLNRIKDEFIACISHEFKTPLTALIGMASLLNNESIGGLNERQKRYVNMIHQNGRHLTFMLDNVMDLAKAETGQLELYPEVISVLDICQQSIQKTQKLIHQDPSLATDLDLNIELAIDPNIETIVADRLRLQQMLINLLSNAIKFTEGLPKIHLSVQTWEDWIAISVKDHGIGIPEDKQHLIFQKFQQLENILTRRYDGVGLGLVLTRHLARLHGGDVTFVSQAGKGSEFTVLLPPTPQHLSPPQPPAKSLVMVVENNPEDVDHLMGILTTMGYRVIIARSGTEALEKARKLQPSLIFLNPELPVLSGWDVLALLKKDVSTARIGVLVIHSELVNLPLSQADWHLPKPIKAENLAFLQAIAHPQVLTVMIIGETHSHLANLIQELGYQALTASDLEQAEVLAKIWHPHLVIWNQLELDPDKISRSKLVSLPMILINANLTIMPGHLNLFNLDQLTSQHLQDVITQMLGN